MEDQSGKHLRLFGTLFFSFIGFIVAIALFLLGMRLLFGLMNYIPWFTYVYMIGILLVPFFLFVTCYIIYIRRTASHPNKVVRFISYSLFAVALIAWAITLFLDVIIFYKHAYNSIGMYHSYDMIFLALNVTCFFLVGIMQALTTVKEKDWMSKSREEAKPGQESA